MPERKSTYQIPRYLTIHCQEKKTQQKVKILACTQPYCSRPRVRFPLLLSVSERKRKQSLLLAFFIPERKLPTTSLGQQTSPKRRYDWDLPLVRVFSHTWDEEDLFGFHPSCPTLHTWEEKNTYFGQSPEHSPSSHKHHENILRHRPKSMAQKLAMRWLFWNLRVSQN